MRVRFQLNAMMLAEVKRQVRPLDLRIQRKSRLEAMLPLQRETQEIEVKLPGLIFREDADDENGGRKSHGLEPCRLDLLHLFSNLRRLLIELDDVGRSGLGLGILVHTCRLPGRRQHGERQRRRDR